MSPQLAHALAHADPVAIGSRIRAARLAADLTQPELGGDQASATYVSRLETGQRRVSPALLELFAERSGVPVESLVAEASTEDARRVELELDHGELSLAGGEIDKALEHARRVLAVKDLAVKDLKVENLAVKDLAVKDLAVKDLSIKDMDAVPGVWARAASLEAAALDALGDPSAADAYARVIAARPGALMTARAATALSRIMRETGDIAAAVQCGESALELLRPDLLGSEEGVRLAVTLAAALFESGQTDRATQLCDEAVREAELLASPLARASAYWNASIVRSETGDLDEAVALARNALSLMESTERIRDLGRLRMQLCDMMLQVNPPRLSEIQQQLSLADAELDWSSASPADATWHHVVTARTMALAGDVSGARRLAADAVLSSDGQLPMIEVGALILLGQIDWENGEHDAARGWFVRAISVLTGVGADRNAGQLWFELGTLADRAGMVDEARDAYRRAAASTGMAARLTQATAHRATV